MEHELDEFGMGIRSNWTDRLDHEYKIFSGLRVDIVNDLIFK